MFRFLYFTFAAACAPLLPTQITRAIRATPTNLSNVIHLEAEQDSSKGEAWEKLMGFTSTFGGPVMNPKYIT